MSSPMLRFAVAVAALTLALPSLALAQESNLVGVYRCEGVSPGGSPYRTVVEITKDEDTYELRWRAAQGNAVGIGIVRGDVLAVSYFTGANMGVVLYRIEKGPKLTGEWSVFGSDGHRYPETLTKLGVDAKDRGVVELLAADAP